MKKPKQEIHIGDQIGNVSVIDIERGAYYVDNRYLIRYSCCGFMGWVGYKPLRARMNGRGGDCRSCANKKVRARMEANNPRPTEHKINQIFVPGWGMTLGSFNRS